MSTVASPVDGQTARVVVVHDYLAARGGAERVVLAMLGAFADCRLLTSVYNPAKTFAEFGHYHVETLPLHSRVLLERDYRLGLALYGAAFRRAEVHDVDVVVCSSSGFAHQVRTDVPKVVYCHNPPRWLFQERDYLRRRLGVERMALALFGSRLRRHDLAGARSATRYLVNSQVVAERVRSAYGIEPVVVHPPYGIGPGGPEAAVAGVPEDFMLLVARSRRYKHVAVAMEAARRARRPLVVVGADPSTRERPAHVVAVGAVDDARLRWLYRRCQGVLAVAFEDFGLTPVEGHAFGKPTLALRRGGYVESIVEGLNGTFIDHLALDEVAAALRRFDAGAYDPVAIAHRAERYSPASFSARLREQVAAALAGVKADAGSVAGGSTELAAS